MRVLKVFGVLRVLRLLKLWKSIESIKSIESNLLANNVKARNPVGSKNIILYKFALLV